MECIGASPQRYLKDCKSTREELSMDPNQDHETCLVVKTSALIQKFKKLEIFVVAPEVEVCNLKIAPDYGVPSYEQRVISHVLYR